MNSRLIRFNKGEILFKAGDSTRNMYIIRSGTVSVMIEKDGKNILITELGRGQYVGEMSFLTGVKRSASVIAASDVLVNEIPSEILDDELFGLSSWAVSVAKVLVRRIRTTTEQLSDYISGHDGKQPVIEPLVDSEQTGIKTVSSDRKTRRLFLKGRFSESSIEAVNKKIREMRVRPDWTLVLDFSDVIDIDQGGINFIYTLIKSHDVAEQRIRIENIQLIRDKVLSIKGLQNILSKTDIPVRNIEKDDFLIRQGAIENVMYYVKNGSFTISRETSNGRITLATAESGDILGEMALIKEGIRSADVVADRRSIVHVIDVRDFYNNVYNVPSWFLELIRGLVQRLRNTNELIVKYESEHHDISPLEEWNLPLSIMLDSTKPGRFRVSGAMTLPNYQYLYNILEHESQKKRKEILLDLSQVTKFDGSCRAALEDTIYKIKKSGVDFKVTYPKKK